MRLRDGTKWFFEGIWRFLVWFGKSFDLPKDEAEKRERLVQTYLVIFGLLLSYSGDPDLQANLMKLFIGFLMVSLIYYSMLARSIGSKAFRNIMAFLMAFIFSSAFILCYIAFADHPTGIWILYLVISCIVALPLLV